MVLDITIEAMDDNPSYNIHRYNTYTVRADDHRILTVVTFSDQILSKWLQDLLKSTKNNRDPLLVAVTAECRSIEYTKRGLRNIPYDILTLCVASHCIIYHLPEERQTTPKSLCAFFDNPRVVVVGMEMETMARKLERDHGIKIKNAVDLRGLAVEGLKKEGEHLDLWHYDLDKVAMTVLGKHVDVVRPLEKVEWYCDDYYFWWWEREMTLTKVKFTTIDAYLCFSVGFDLHDKIKGAGTDQDSFNSKKKKKNKNKKDKKRNL